MQVLRTSYGDIFGEWSVGYDENYEKYVRWIESEKTDIDTAKLALDIDQILQDLHRDYREVRQGDGMKAPEVKLFAPGHILSLMKQKGKM